MQTNEIIGYRVQCEDGMFVHAEWLGGPGRFHHYLASQEPEPVSRPDAYRRLAGFIEENPENDMEYEVVPVFRVLTPLETASKELGGLLQSLLNRHGLELGLTQEQIEAKIGQELQELGAGGATFIATGIPRDR